DWLRWYVPSIKAESTSARDSRIVLPFSRVTIRASSSRDSFKSRRKSATHCWRVVSGVRRHDLNADCAASIASRTSSVVDDWKKAILLPRKAGFSFSNVTPLRDLFHSPLMKLLSLHLFSNGPRGMSTLSRSLATIKVKNRRYSQTEGRADLFERR